MTTPLLETDRLFLRQHKVTDLDDILALWNDEITYRYISGSGTNREECWGRLMRHAGHWQLCGFGYWVAEEKATGRFVGQLGFGDFKREMTPSLLGTLEAGWVVNAAFHGKGFAAEAMHAALDWAQAHFAHLPITCLIHPDNAPSIKLAERLSFVTRCTSHYKDSPSLIMDWRIGMA